MKPIFLLFVIANFIFLFSCTNKQQQQTDENYNWAMLPFNKLDSKNPVMQPGNNTFFCPVKNMQLAWEAKNVFNPATAVRNDTLFLLYRAQDSAGTSRIGLAWSIDGTHFIRDSSPVLFPQNDAYKKYEWPGGCEDPRMVQDSSGTYFMTYTAYDGKTARLMIAASNDLRHWTKHGCVFAKALNGKYRDAWSKSGAIVSTYSDGKIIASKLNGKYWMYWGDKYIWAATSDDLINWTPIETSASENNNYDSVYAAFNISELQIAAPTRKEMFDNNIVESGPPAMLTDTGILLFYNGRNIKAGGDTSLADGTYTAAQILFDKTNPMKIISRMNHFFMQPQQAYELTGEVNNVCFIEGLANYKNKWWLYYGTADSKIAVAVHE